MTEIIQLIMDRAVENLAGNYFILFALLVFFIVMILIFIRAEKWALAVIPLPLIIKVANMGIPNAWFKYAVFMVLGVFWFLMLVNIFKNN